MKTFNSLREKSLEEKLKASDPAGKYISDFVHSDNPKFAGKSKKERINMALGASYSAKRQNEETELLEFDAPIVWKKGSTHIEKYSDDSYSVYVDDKKTKSYKTLDDAKKNAMTHLDEAQLDELKTSTLLRYSTKANKALIGGDRSKEPKRIQGIQKAVSKIKDRHTVKEEGELTNEAAWGKDKMANLKVAHDRHSEKALAANKAGDDAATKLHQSKMNMIKTQMNKLRKESVEPSVTEGKIKVNFKMPPESLADKMARKHAELRKKSGLPDPEHYKKLAAQKQKEIEDMKKEEVKGDYERKVDKYLKKKYNKEEVEIAESIKDNIEQTLADKDINSKVEGNKVHVHPDNTARARSILSKMGTGHTVHGSLKEEEDMEEAVGYGKPKKAYTKYHMKQYGDDSHENDHENDPPPSNPYHAAKRERILKALNTFGDEMKKKNPSLKEEILSEISKKMKGKDPCWDDYKMIGTKMKNGKPVPNCVPKEETEISGSSIDEAKPGLYANIHAKRKRIDGGSNERMRTPGTKGAPTAKSFKDAAKTAKK